MTQRKQSRKASLAETLLSTALGFGTGVAAQIIVFPWFGVILPVGSNVLIGAIFTVVSIVRGFAVRRLFEALRVRGVLP